MTKSPIFIGLSYLLLGVGFIALTFINVNQNGWGFVSFLTAFIAAVDLYVGWLNLQRGFKKKPNQSD
ncbi:DUF4305 domain-containing protein [Shouchella clausii]|uniref:hypothetical protein n=1 Tax=Shouchella clausii TaxID=79880 RepID=UPI000BA5BA1A|nr:hypothetical protein [Shouchella clausii]PAD91942.1 hypothetical protein CHH52_12395 [Shouchella clausii]